MRAVSGDFSVPERDNIQYIRVAVSRGCGTLSVLFSPSDF